MMLFPDMSIKQRDCGTFWFSTVTKEEWLKLLNGVVEVTTVGKLPYRAFEDQTAWSKYGTRIIVLLMFPETPRRWAEEAAAELRLKGLTQKIYAVQTASPSHLTSVDRTSGCPRDAITYIFD